MGHSRASPANQVWKIPGEESADGRRFLRERREELFTRWDGDQLSVRVAKEKHQAMLGTGDVDIMGQGIRPESCGLLSPS